MPKIKINYSLAIHSRHTNKSTRLMTPFQIANFRNPTDYFIVSITYVSNTGKQELTRRTTSDLLGLVNWCEREGLKWLYINVEYRYTERVEGQLQDKIGQVATFSTLHPPLAAMPTRSDCIRYYRILKRNKVSEGLISRNVAAIRAYLAEVERE